MITERETVFMYREFLGGCTLTNGAYNIYRVVGGTLK